MILMTRPDLDKFHTATLSSTKYITHQSRAAPPAARRPPPAVRCPQPAARTMSSWQSQLPLGSSLSVAADKGVHCTPAARTGACTIKPPNSQALSALELTCQSPTPQPPRRHVHVGNECAADPQWPGRLATTSSTSASFASINFADAGAPDNRVNLNLLKPPLWCLPLPVQADPLFNAVPPKGKNNVVKKNVVFQKYLQVWASVQGLTFRKW